MRIALYARVSSQSQHADLPPQLDRLRGYASSRWPKAQLEDFVDIESGAHLRRPSLQRALALIAKRKLDVVVIEKLDRLSRSLADGIQLVDRISSSGCSLVALDQPIDTSTPAGRAGLHLLQVFAEWQREDLRERTLKGIAAAKERGVRFGRRGVDFDVEQARRLVDKGLPVTRVAEQFGVSRFALRRRLAASVGCV
jgi:DNA invertase Pin-like site-specific DNA recombinase